MGWREREWARFTGEERRALYGSSEPTRGRRGVGRFRAGAGLAVAVSAALFALGQLPRDEPVVPRLHLALPGLGSIGRSEHAPARHGLRLDPISPLHSRLTITGTSPGHAGERLRLEGHLGGRPWHTLALADVAADGRVVFTIRLDRPGMLNLRVALPGGDVLAGSTRVRRRPG